MIGGKTATCAVCGDLFEYFPSYYEDDDPEGVRYYFEELFRPWLCKKCQVLESELRKRLYGDRPQHSWERASKNSKPGLKMDLASRRSGAPLRREADRLEKRPRRRRERPPQLTADDAAELKKLRAQIFRIKIRALERAIAEWEDVWASPTALRYLADEIDEARAEEKREREERERRNRESSFGFSLQYTLQDFETLGVSEQATKEQINQRYRELVKTLHPDANDGSTAKVAMFHSVTKAMQRLRERGRA